MYTIIDLVGNDSLLGSVTKYNGIALGASQVRISARGPFMILYNII